MAYDASKHAQFAQSMTKWMQDIWRLKQEAATLTAIYQNEGDYSNDPAFGDYGSLTEQELIDAIVFQAAFKAVIDGGEAISQTDRTSNVTPFLSGE